MSLTILRPLRTNCITQGFGPEKTSIRMLPIYQKMGLKAHNGVDIACWRGEPIYHSANFEGKAKTEIDMKGGIGVDIISSEKFEDGYYRKLRYWHFKKLAVYDGQIIKMGDLIGWGDNTGMSTGNHLHLGFKRCDENGEPVDRNNGYYGARDFSQWFENEFIHKETLDTLKLIIENLRSKLIELKYVYLVKTKQK